LFDGGAARVDERPIRSTKTAGGGIKAASNFEGATACSDTRAAEEASQDIL
jgi:hypothetical protein